MEVELNIVWCLYFCLFCPSVTVYSQMCMCLTGSWYSLLLDYVALDTAFPHMTAPIWTPCGDVASVCVLWRKLDICLLP